MFYLVILGLIALDLFTKYIAKIQFIETYYIFKDLLFLKYVENNGIAFSIQLTGILLKIFTIIVLIIIWLYYIKKEKKKENLYINLSFALIIAGGISNGYERIFNNYVVDFIGVKYFSIFNLADVYITIGTIIYLMLLFLIKDKKNEIH